MEPGGSTEVLPPNLGNLESVQGFGDDFTRRHDRLDVPAERGGTMDLDDLMYDRGGNEHGSPA